MNTSNSSDFDGSSDDSDCEKGKNCEERVPCSCSVEEMKWVNIRHEDGKLIERNRIHKVSCARYRK